MAGNSGDRADGELWRKSREKLTGLSADAPDGDAVRRRVAEPSGGGAARDEATRARRMTAFEKVAGSLANVEIPGWETSESAAQWVSASRRGEG